MSKTTNDNNNQVTAGDTIDINNILYRVEDIDRDDEVKRATLIEEWSPHGLIEDPNRRDLVKVNGETFITRPDDIDAKSLPECADVTEEAVSIAGISDGPDDAAELVSAAQHILNADLDEPETKLVTDSVAQKLNQ